MKRLPAEQKQKLEVLRACRYFDGVADKILVQLAEQTHLYHYASGETIFWENEPCAGLHIIHSGTVKLLKLSPQGRELIFRVIGEGDSFNEVPVFDQGSNPVSAVSIGLTEVWIVRCDTIRQVTEKHPEMAAAIILNLTTNLRMLVNLASELSFYQVTNRLARLLVQLPQEQLLGVGDQRLTQDELASHLGTVREVVARSLRELERSGAIQVARRQIQIVDQDRLMEWAQLPEC